MNPINTSRHPIQRLQRWMQTTVMHPDGVVEGMNSPAARGTDRRRGGRGREGRHALEGADGRGAAVDLRQRLLRPAAGVHAGGVPGRDARPRRGDVRRFRGGLSPELPVAQLHADPSSGTDFPRFLVETRPEREEGEPEVSWPEFLADLARFEWTFSEVFDGPGRRGRRS